MLSCPHCNEMIPLFKTGGSEALAREMNVPFLFYLAPDGAVEASFACNKVFQGYPATLHGGIISGLLDGAMTNCLFAHGHASMTAEINIRFRRHFTSVCCPAARWRLPIWTRSPGCSIAPRRPQAFTIMGLIVNRSRFISAARDLSTPTMKRSM